jgi:hypothetical protein
VKDEKCAGADDEERVDAKDEEFWFRQLRYV